jgi:hypothetical protein
MAIFCRSPPDSSTPFLKLADHLVVAVRQPLDHRIGLAALARRARSAWWLETIIMMMKLVRRLISALGHLADMSSEGA